MKMMENVFEKDGNQDKRGGNLAESLRLRTFIQMAHLVEEERFDDACKLAWAVGQVFAI